MSRVLILALAASALATSAEAAADPHAGHSMPAEPAPAADPHAGHAAPAPAASDPHAGHAMPMPTPARRGADLPVGSAAPPPPPVPVADSVFGKEAMDRARSVLRREHGGARWSSVMGDRLELRPGRGRDLYAWDVGFSTGGDFNRFRLRSEGEGEIDGRFHGGEVEALYSRAIGPYFDLQAGVRQDIRHGPDRTYAAVGVEGLAPYWFDVKGALYLSDKADVTARLEATYDLRLTQRLILQPAAEVELAAQDVPELAIGSGLARGEFGLRLRYEVRRTFAPYVGVHYARSIGRTADLVRAAGEPVGDTRFVVGLRTWF